MPVSPNRPSRRKANPSGGPPSRNEDPGRLIPEDRKLDILGIALILFAVFTMLSFFSPEEVALPNAWVMLLRRLFGIGAYLAPVLIALPGGYLVLRHFRESLPIPPFGRTAGAVLLVLNAMVSAHFFLFPAHRDELFAQAWQGAGGGLLGGGILHLLLETLDYPGTALVLIAWLSLGLILAFRISLVQAAGKAANRLRAVWLFVRKAGSKIRTRFEYRQAGMQTGGEPWREASVDAVDSLSEWEPEELEQPEADGDAAKPEPAQVEPIRPVRPDSEIGVPVPPPPWRLPDPGEILNPGVAAVSDEELDRRRARIIEEALVSFDAPAKVVEINRGPTVTQFGVEPGFLESRGGKSTRVKVSKITARVDDLTLALSAPSIRIQAPVPGKGFVGIEVPNTEISLVALRDVIETGPFQKKNSPLRFALGKDVSGGPAVSDLSAMPHLLIAGTTGSGKSVCLNAIIACFLLHNTPDDLRFLMVDPKRVELTSYNGIPHLLAPVIVEQERVVGALQWVTREMETRLQKFSQSGVRNLAEYNLLLAGRKEKPLPVWVVVIDELADLMLTAPDETERILARIAQIARAAGIHMILATQRPSVNVLTGIIKANFPARIAFAVASQVDSRVILDQPGAERLLGRGDMLFQAPDSPAPVRLQGAYVSEAELVRLVHYWRGAFAERKAASDAAGGSADAAVGDSSAAGLPDGPLQQVPMFDKGEVEESEDKLLEEAIRAVRRWRKASTTRLQRNFGIGYTRAARLMDVLEDRGIIGPPTTGSQPREVIDFGDEEEEL